MIGARHAVRAEPLRAPGSETRSSEDEDDGVQVLEHHEHHPYEDQPEQMPRNSVHSFFPRSCRHLLSPSYESSHSVAPFTLEVNTPRTACILGGYALHTQGGWRDDQGLRL